MRVKAILTAIILLGLINGAMGQSKRHKSCDPCKVQDRLYLILDSMYKGTKPMVKKDSLYNLFMVNNLECQRISILGEK